VAAVSAAVGGVTVGWLETGSRVFRAYIFPALPLRFGGIFVVARNNGVVVGEGCRGDNGSRRHCGLSWCGVVQVDGDWSGSGVGITNSVIGSIFVALQLELKSAVRELSFC